MKRLWIALGLLLSLLSLSLLHAGALEDFTHSLAGEVHRARYLAGAEDWAAVCEILEDTEDRWLARSSALHILLRHSDTDRIQSLLFSCRRLAEDRETGPCRASLCELEQALRLLSGAEQLTLENLL